MMLTREELLDGSVFPAIWEVYPTMACNLRCTYCYLSLDKSPWKNRITPQYEIGDLVNFLRWYACKGDMISLIGGEPFAAIPWVEKLFALINPLGVITRYHAFTNGTLLGQIAGSMLSKFTYLTISIDGDESTTDRERGPGVFKTILSNLERHKKILKGRTVGRLTVMPQNNLYHDVLALIPYFEVIYWQFANGIDLSRFNVSVRTQQVEQLLDMWFDSLIVGEVINLYPFTAIVSRLLEAKEGRELPYPPKNAIGCGSGFNYFQITTDGKLYVCPELIDQERGYMGDLWSGFTRKLNARDFNNTAKCKDCPAYLACHTRCIHFTPEEYCRIIRHTVATVNDRLPLIKYLVEKKVVSRQVFKVKSHYEYPRSLPVYLHNSAELELMF